MIQQCGAKPRIPITGRRAAKLGDKEGDRPLLRIRRSHVFFYHGVG